MTLPWEAFCAREKHCDEDTGGESHFHCAKCGAVCSVMGHIDDECVTARAQGRDRPRFVYGVVGA